MLKIKKYIFCLFLGVFFLTGCEPKQKKLFMKTQIICSPGLEKYGDFVKQIIAPFDNAFGDGNGNVYIVKKPIRAIFILTRAESQAVLGHPNHFGREITLDQKDYDNIKNQNMDRTAVDELIKSKPLSPQMDTLGFWFASPPNFKIQSVGLIPHEYYMVLTPEVINTVAAQIKATINDLKIKNIENSILKMTVIHELGHHYTLSNLLINGAVPLDSNLSEGFANWFAYQLLDEEERKLMAEAAIDQPLPYRYYYLLRYSNVSSVLGAMITKTNYIEALQNFASIIGGKLEFNGSPLTVGA